jgi:hypothetical protein
MSLVCCTVQIEAYDGKWESRRLRTSRVNAVWTEHCTKADWNHYKGCTVELESRNFFA